MAKTNTSKKKSRRSGRQGTLQKLTKTQKQEIIKDIRRTIRKNPDMMNNKKSMRKEEFWRKRFSSATNNIKQKLYNKLYNSFKKGRLNKTRIANIKNRKKQNKVANRREKLEVMYGRSFKNLGELPLNYTNP